MLRQSFSLNCTPCPSNTYSLGAAHLIGDVVSNVECFAECPYGGSCESGGDEVKARPGFYGSKFQNDVNNDDHSQQKQLTASSSSSTSGKEASSSFSLLTDSAAIIKFTQCPSGYCCEAASTADDDEQLCDWNDTCVGHRTGKLCGDCEDGYSVAVRKNRQSNVKTTNRYCAALVCLLFLYSTLFFLLSPIFF